MVYVKEKTIDIFATSNCAHRTCDEKFFFFLDHHRAKTPNSIIRTSFNRPYWAMFVFVCAQHHPFLYSFVLTTFVGIHKFRNPYGWLK